MQCAREREFDVELTLRQALLSQDVRQSNNSTQEEQFENNCNDVWIQSGNETTTVSEKQCFQGRGWQGGSRKTINNLTGTILTK